ncbi:hypothetical protein CEP52_001015 [Fusarium oligoseptatum]|uniref:Mitochondrial division protein 1 n=1 Tax=Fusarium oligoseptatum TaxID=2604345 RepID=A0A428UL00_9HYPO|nr:hypothetical protein CEP52_001015 [Fusarium oligoseptatum]
MLLCGIIDQLDRSTNPLSYFFCQATEKDQSSDTAAMRGLIYTILDHYPLLMPKLRVEYDKKGKKLFDSPNTSLLLDGVLTDMLQDPILEDAVFIIDALDECKTGRSNLVKLIVKLSSSCRVRWIVSSRDWPEIKQEFRGIQGLVSITLEENKDEVAQAVQSYIRTKVDDLAKRWDEDDEDDDSDDDNIDDNDDKDSTEDLKKTVYDYMVSHAEDTFLWVALVCKRLAESDVPKRRVTEELEMFPKGLPDLYELMMDRILKYSRPESDRLKAVLAAACLAHGHLKSKDMIDFIPSMAKYNNKDVKGTIGACGSFLTYQNGVIYFVHQSAKEYLLNEGVGHVFPHGVEQPHLQMALRCLEILQSGLKGENIYGLSSYGTLIGEFTRPSPDPLSPLEYSCLHWADHLVQSGACSKDHVVDKALCFLRDKFTYWLEALSLLGQLSVAAKAIEGIEPTLVGVVKAKDLLEFLRDARRFVRYHKAAIEISPRQVYASALVFSPRCSIVRRNWDNRIETISTGSHGVWSVACSLDGRLFAAACGKEAKVYDAASGIATFACIKSIETDRVYCVLFSPDGERLAIVGHTRAAHIWNWKTGDQVHELLGHSDSILSAAFLGKNRLVTGSTDGTAKIWDLATDACEQTLKDHDFDIQFATSPDGERFATGSIDGTVKIWQQAADTGEWTCSQTLHHGYIVWAVSFSVDGRILITSSDDGIRFWDEAGVCIRTMSSHGIRVNSLSVYPTGQQLLTSSLLDGNIRLWDISTLDSSAESPQEAQLSSELDDNYINQIINFVFSPDGKTLVSHSCDGETKIWNVETGSCVLAQEPSNSHKPFLYAPTIASAWLACPTGDERAVMRDQEGDTAVWDLVESKRLGPPGESTRMSPFSPSFGDGVLIYSPDTKFYAVSTSGDPVSVYYAPTGERVYTSSPDDTPLAFSPDSRELFLYKLGYGAILPYRCRLDDEIFHKLGLGQAETSTDGFLLDTQFGTMEADGHSNDVKLVGWGLSLERDWILRGSERMLYIPVEHRKLIMDAKRKRFAIACPTGRIVTLEVA